MRLSKHFLENWGKRVGDTPSEKRVIDLVRHSIRVQKGLKLLTLEGNPFNTLSMFWRPDLDLVLQIDRFTDTAVSVLSKENMPLYQDRQIADYYTPLTMHLKYLY